MDENTNTSNSTSFGLQGTSATDISGETTTTVAPGSGTNAVLTASEQGFTFVDVANLFVALAIIIAAGLSVFYIFVGGISFILSGGQEDKVKQAVHTIRYAIIGLIVTIFAVTIIAILGSIFNFDLVSYISWSKITQMMGAIVDRLTDSSSPSGGSLG